MTDTTTRAVLQQSQIISINHTPIPEVSNGERAKKLNFFVEEGIRRELDKLVPVGQKSKIINEALRKELLRIKREKVTAKLLALKSRGAMFSKRELVATLMKDRRRES